MPARRTPLINNEYYHILNRAITAQPLFLYKRDYLRMTGAIEFYRNTALPVKYSFFLRMPRQDKLPLWDKIKQKNNHLIEIISYCLMPNHFHFLLKQTKKRGIEKFIGNLINSYTKYFNTKRKRLGPLFQGRFKAIRVETEEQLLHLSRYIHLNPYSSGIVKSKKELLKYSYSSFPEYLRESKREICTKEVILNRSRTKKQYQQFVLDNADYQKRLQKIKNLLFST